MILPSVVEGSVKLGKQAAFAVGENTISSTSRIIA
jgi:hypothetical protein